MNDHGPGQARGVGVIFDWDGVVVDSAALHERSWEVLADETGLTLPAGHFVRGFGMTNERIIPEVLQWTRRPPRVRELAERKEAIYRRLAVEQGVAPLPGVRRLLADLQAHHIPAAVASSSSRQNITTLLPVMQLDGYFRELVTACDVTHGKPHPEVFEKAAERLHVEPARAIVIEDALVGIEAAHAAGMHVVAVTTTHGREALAAADRIVSTLDEVSATDLMRWLEPAEEPAGSCARCQQKE